MSGNGAYEDEMNDVAMFMDSLRAEVAEQPDPRLGAELVPRLAEAARAATIEAESKGTRRGAAALGAGRRPRSRFALVARIGIAVAAVPLLLAGLAFAGVTVPHAAREAFATVGIELPNQPATRAMTTSPGHGASGPAARESTNGAKDTSSGTPSKGKSAAAHQQALEQKQKAQGKAIGHDRGKAIGLNGSTPPGQGVKPGPPAHSNSGGSPPKSHAAPNPVKQPPPAPTPGGSSKGHEKPAG